MNEQGGISVTRVGRAGQEPATDGLIELAEAECWSRLETETLGRLTVVIAGEPHTFPVNFGVSGGATAFRTGPGTKLDRGAANRASFEVDGYDPVAGTGWSVVARGVLLEITGGLDTLSQELQGLPVRPAAPGDRSSWMAVGPSQITGCLFRKDDPDRHGVVNSRRFWT